MSRDAAPKRAAERESALRWVGELVGGPIGVRSRVGYETLCQVAPSLRHVHEPGFVSGIRCVLRESRTLSREGAIILSRRHPRSLPFPNGLKAAKRKLVPAQAAITDS